MQKDAEGGCAGAWQECVHVPPLFLEEAGPNQNSYNFSHVLNAPGFIHFLAKHSSQKQARGPKYCLHTSV